MYKFPIGVMLDSFREAIPEAMKKAAALGAQGMQMYAYKEYSPETVTTEKVRELLDMSKSHGLVFSAICGDFGYGFDDKNRNKEFIERSKRILELAKSVESNIVTTHIAIIPEDKNDDRYKIMQDACFSLAEFADSMDAHFAIETGMEPAHVLKAFLDDLHSKGVAVNFDPANLTIQDPYGTVKDVYTLRDYIVHTHAKDAVNISIHDEATRNWFIQNAKIEDEVYSEVPLGKGDVPFPEYLAALEDVGYKGFLTIEREVGVNPAEDIGEAVKYLRSLTGR